ncbi:MAG: hypothetical protein BWY87_01235 [Deltaproteobacteria bacterium ADurb.Bin510]|nr:MAG: hypothetical protein BWY87_01235 [Deltaproteobacteria bacterium ADurb.Bin510]
MRDMSIGVQATEFLAAVDLGRGQAAGEVLRQVVVVGWVHQGGDRLAEVGGRLEAQHGFNGRAQVGETALAVQAEGDVADVLEQLAVALLALAELFAHAGGLGDVRDDAVDVVERAAAVAHAGRGLEVHGVAGLVAGADLHDRKASRLAVDLAEDRPDALHVLIREVPLDRGADHLGRAVPQDGLDRWTDEADHGLTVDGVAGLVEVIDQGAEHDLRVGQGLLDFGLFGDVLHDAADADQAAGLVAELQREPEVQQAAGLGKDAALGDVGHLAAYGRGECLAQPGQIVGVQKVDEAVADEFLGFVAAQALDAGADVGEVAAGVHGEGHVAGLVEQHLAETFTLAPALFLQPARRDVAHNADQAVGFGGRQQADLDLGLETLAVEQREVEPEGRQLAGHAAQEPGGMRLELGVGYPGRALQVAVQELGAGEAGFAQGALVEEILAGTDADRLAGTVPDHDQIAAFRREGRDPGRRTRFELAGGGGRNHESSLAKWVFEPGYGSSPLNRIQNIATYT